MSQVWEGDKVVPVTVINATPNLITLIRTKEKDGYQAIQIALGRTKREFRVEDLAEYESGKELTVAAFEPGQKVKVSGLNKGRGFQGVVKRHGFAGVGMATHGQKNRQRHPGSIGSTAPQRVVPGRKMAGHMGNERVTIKNLRVVEVDPVKNTIAVKGAVPGARGALLEIRN